MKTIFAIILAVLINDPKEIAKINSLKKEAEAAYKAKDYELALSKYTILHDSLGIDDPAIKLNLAHSHYHLGDTSGAKLNYGRLLTSESNKLKSIAMQQLGVMSKDAGKLEEALQQLKSAIKADPSNQEARYNYEVVKKLLEEQKKQEQQQKEDQENKDGEEQQEQQNKDEQEKKDGEQEDQKNQEGDQEKSDEEKKNQEQQNQEQKEGEEQDQEKSQDQMTKEKLEEMGISEEKARQLLEAMRQSEIKYLQQQRRKPTKRPPSGKPDW